MKQSPQPQVLVWNGRVAETERKPETSDGVSGVEDDRGDHPATVPSPPDAEHDRRVPR